MKYVPCQEAIEEAAREAFKSPPGADSDTICAVALTTAFPIMLADSLESDVARDVTGAYGFTTSLGDEFRGALVRAASGRDA